MRLPPDTPLAEAEWIPRNRVANLKRLGLETLASLVTHYPRRHEDRSRFEPFPDAATARPVLLRGVIVKTAWLPYGRWRRGYEATLEDEGGALARRVSCRWFNMPYVAKSLAAGLPMIVFGKARQRGAKLVIDFPEYELLDDASDALIHLNRITPVHPAGEGVTPRRLREWIFRALDATDLDRMPALLPGAGASRAQALRDIHFPACAAALETARQTLVAEEFFAMQALIASRRAHHAALPGIPKTSPGRLMARLHASLPFTLTAAQSRAIAQIRDDMAAPRRMNRLLQGDVGSGKTIVALSAALLAVEAGCQAAVMVPTQILAGQHHETFTRLLEPLGLTVALRTAARQTGGGLDLWTGGQAPHVVVGTHALLFEPEALQNPGLVIIDEQHKFGVLQRARLIESGHGPDVLVMTATPIPRTLAQTAYGDLDITTIDERPANRGKVITGVRDAAKLPEAAVFIRAQLDAGRQAYIVYPLIEESAKLEAKAAAGEFEKWKPLLAPHACALLHGRLKADEKDAVMRDFREGAARALITTTVIEVGVDVPNATVMLIENAERFGLAQLHQLRGRIGRGGHKSFCILIPGDPTPEAREKLAVLEQSSDGFVIAEADLLLRGAGDLLGTDQTGLPPLRLGDLIRDAAIIKQARDHARSLFATDPALARPEHAHLKAWLLAQEAKFRALAG